MVTLESGEDDEREGRVYVEGEVLVGKAAPLGDVSLADAQSTCLQPQSVVDHYGQLAAVNIVWGEGWKWTEEAFGGETLEAGGLVKLAPPAGMGVGTVPLHPVVIDDGTVQR